MYGKAPTKTTMYSEFVKANVTTILGAGEGQYDIKALAAACGLKPTHNFKRRVLQLVDDGLVAIDLMRTEDGRYIAVYGRPEVDQELPF